MHFHIQLKKHQTMCNCTVDLESEVIYYIQYVNTRLLNSP